MNIEEKRAKHAAYMRRWYRKHIEKNRSRDRIYRRKRYKELSWIREKSYIRTRKWALKHPEIIRERARRYRTKQNPENIRLYMKEWRRKNKAYLREIQKNYRTFKRHRWLAHTSLEQAVKNGVIKKPDHCSNCNIKSRLDGHHHQGYDRSNRLNVIWLCRLCHNRLHKLMDSRPLSKR